MHLKVIFQLLMCGSDAATTPVVCTSALAILPQFDPKMRSLALLEAEIPFPLYVTGKNNVDFFLIDCGCCCLSFMYGCGGSNNG